MDFVTAILGKPSNGLAGRVFSPLTFSHAGVLPDTIEDGAF
jgi:hypothetical protein